MWTRVDGGRRWTVSRMDGITEHLKYKNVDGSGRPDRWTKSVRGGVLIEGFPLNMTET